MILAIDASTAVIGISILGHKKVEAGEFEYRNLLHVFRSIDTIIKHYRPEFLAIEDTYLGANPTTYKVLERVRAVVYLAAMWNCIPEANIIEAGASTIRKHVFGKGNIKKDEVCQRLEAHFGRTFKTKGYDASDSLAMALYAAGTIIP